MRNRLILLSVVVSIVALAMGAMQAEKASANRKMNSLIYVTADKASYEQAPGGGASMATIWGDLDNGPHATFTKFKPGFDAGMHTHPNDVWLVVIRGAYLYKDEAGEKRVGPGDFIRIPGGHKHWSGGDKTEGALFYEEGSGKFDTVAVK